MIISSTVLNNALKARSKSLKHKKEGYSMLNSANDGMNLGFATGFLISAVVFVMLEILVLFYGLQIAINCTKAGPERIVHIVLAIVFTFPYVLMSVFFSPCAKKTLTNM